LQSFGWWWCAGFHHHDGGLVKALGRSSVRGVLGNLAEKGRVFTHTARWTRIHFHSVNDRWVVQ
jgi:hypothetical protein